MPCLAWLLATLVAGMLDSRPAAAQQDDTQDVTKGVTVRERARPDFEPEGLRLGTFLLFPKLGITETYNDNLFATRKRAKTDYITTFTPELMIESDWGIHAASLLVQANILKHTRFGAEDTNNVLAEFSGRYDTYRENNIELNAAFEQGHESRTSPDDVNGAEPTVFNRALLETSYFHRFTLLSAKVGGSAEGFNYNDVPTATGFINNDDRDRLDVRGTVRVDYDIDQENGIFARGGYLAQLYPQELDDTGFDRDSHGYSVQSGWKFELSGVLFGEAGVGYFKQKIDDPSIDSVKGIGLKGEMFWNPTGLTSVNLLIDRGFRQSTLQNASGSISTDVYLAVDHELLVNLILSPSIRYVFTNFDGIQRKDHFIEPAFEVRYLANKEFQFSASYEMQRRLSDVDGIGFNANIARVRLDILL